MSKTAVLLALCMRIASNTIVFQEQVKRLRAAGLKALPSLLVVCKLVLQGQSVPSNNPAQMPDMTGINNLGSAIAMVCSMI